MGIVKQFSISICLGVDGLTPQFYGNHWDVVGIDITSAAKYIFQPWQIPCPMVEGLIRLIPQGEGPSDDIAK